MPLKDGTDFIMPHYGECSDYQIMLDNHILNLIGFGAVAYSPEQVKVLDTLVRKTFKNLVVERVVSTYSIKQDQTKVRVFFREKNARPKRFSVSWPEPVE